jgi:uncharacterized protein DUF3108
MSRAGLASRIFLLASALLLAPLPSNAAAEWESTVPPLRPGSFPQLRPVAVKYGFGWSGFTAATADLRFDRLPGGQLRFEASGGTTGLAEKLWDYEVKHTGLVDAQTLRPVEVKEFEKIRSKQLRTDVKFSAQGVTSDREEKKGTTVKSKIRRFDFPNTLSLNAAFLYLRSQPLTDGAVHRIVVYPATSAYLCTATVQGHESLTVPAGTYDAIKLDLQLMKIDKDRELQPHKKFRKGTVWISNDADRIVLRIEADVFIGTVFTELQSVQFDPVKK